jgi:hypothetical protein
VEFLEVLYTHERKVEVSFTKANLEDEEKQKHESQRKAIQSKSRVGKLV